MKLMYDIPPTHKVWLGVQHTPMYLLQTAVLASFFNEVHCAAHKVFATMLKDSDFIDWSTHPQATQICALNNIPVCDYRQLFKWVQAAYHNIANEYCNVKIYLAINPYLNKEYHATIVYLMQSYPFGSTAIPLLQAKDCVEVAFVIVDSRIRYNINKTLLQFIKSSTDSNSAFNIHFNTLAQMCEDHTQQTTQIINNLSSLLQVSGTYLHDNVAKTLKELTDRCATRLQTCTYHMQNLLNYKPTAQPNEVAAVTTPPLTTNSNNNVPF